MHNTRPPTGVSALEEASAGWQSFAVGAVGAGVGAGGCVGCAGCGACTSLCAAWAAARARGLAALARAAAAARALCTQPPPAIAMQHAQVILVSGDLFIIYIYKETNLSGYGIGGVNNKIQIKLYKVALNACP